jgi:signal transduction histidine kinase
MNCGMDCVGDCDCFGSVCAVELAGFHATMVVVAKGTGFPTPVILTVKRMESVYKWYLPTFSEILALHEPEAVPPTQRPLSLAQRRVRAERDWFGAIAALNQLLQQFIAESDPQPAVKGVLLSGPLPVLTQPHLVQQIATWTLTVGRAGEIALRLPAAVDTDGHHDCLTPPTLPLLPDDPLAAEPFCLVLTPQFSLAMVLGEVEGMPAFLFSFEPEVVWQVWRSLQARLMLVSPQPLGVLNGLVDQFPAVAPDYRIVAQFGRLMLAHLPEPTEMEGKRAKPQPVQPPKVQLAGMFGPGFGRPTKKAKKERADTELLKAIAHEVRTPLTTIRTLTRLLLKRQELCPDVIKRLKVIDQECTEQIDRFSLFFKAVELETTDTTSPLSPLAPISLAQVFQQNTPRWQQQAQQHSHTLDIVLPQKMPMVMTDPTLLDQALTGLIDRITHSLPPGSHIQVKVTLAGHQLKLQIESKSDQEADKFGWAPTLRSLGQLLMFQPETGNLSLSMPVTKNFFQALGGKLIVRQHAQQGEVLTIFLPLDRKMDD